MLKNEYTLNVDLKRRLTSTVPTFRQGDNAVLRFRVYDNGKLFDLSTYTSSEITFVLPSGAQLIGNLDLVNGELVYNFTRAEMAEIGKIETFLSITSGSTTVSIQPFYCFIFGTMNSENLSYIGILQELIKETQDLGLSIQGIATQVAETLQLAEDELANLESLVATITADELDRTNAENARLESESIRVSNENNRFNQENNRVSSESQRVSAEQIRLASEVTREQNEIVRQEILNNLKSFNYSSVQSYVFPNTVLYNGSTYLALKNNTGITPINDGVNWRLAAQRGVDGSGAVASVNGILPDIDGDIVLQDLLDHERNLTENLHIEVLPSIPTDLSQSGIIITTDGANATAGLTPTLDQFEDDVREILNEFRDENAQFEQQFTQQFTQHLTQRISHHLVVNRDVSLVGVQHVEAPFKFKTASITAVLMDTDKFCIGSIAETGGQFNLHKNQDGNMYFENNLITLNTATGTIRGYIDNITDTGFDITWLHEGGPTGVLQMSMCIITHGGDV